MRKSDSVYLSAVVPAFPAAASQSETKEPRAITGYSLGGRLLVKKRLKLIYKRLRREISRYDEAALLLQGKEMAWRAASLPITASFREVGFKVFSQWDEDGIIQHLISKLRIENETFIEFGVENYEESNTRFLMLNNNWQGMVLDGCKVDIRAIHRDPIYWQYDLQANAAWITRANINELLCQSGFSPDVGLLSIDIDGNDYWIWEAIQSIRPRIVIVEYNGLFKLAPVAVPYRDDFNRTSAHHSNLYYGSSLAALHSLGTKKGYILVGSNCWGHNAFFVRSDVAGDFKSLEPQEVYVTSKFREARDSSGHLTYTRGDDRIKLIEHLPVVNVETGEVKPLRHFVKQRDSNDSITTALNSRPQL
ncbi:MAG TPA: hypothetical protein VN884_03595 [Candidatus Sulfotelmatobacter sp.]|jgi:hypothetical protein|nr:hypothetical protein [Candidatus Sulfotelmatobacter sp.]